MIDMRAREELGYGRRVRVVESDDNDPIPIGEYTVEHVSPIAPGTPPGWSRFRPLGDFCSHYARLEIADGKGPLPVY